MELFKSRPRVAYTNAVGDKVYPVVVDIKKGIKSTEDIQFVSSDVNTGILSVAFIQGNDNYNVTGADVVCSVMRPDASTLELPCEVVGENIVEVPLGINGTSQDGVYSFDFKVFKGENKVVGTPIMNYSVSLSIDNGMVVEEDDRLPVLTVLMTQLTELKGEARESINQANTATVASREATANAIESTNNANAVSERVSQETSEAITRVDNKVNEVETRFNALTTSQQQDAEVIDARDGEVSLKARLDRDIEKAKQVYVELEGSYISTESSTGAIQDLEILGNTVQDPNNLADIKSVGELQEDGTYKMSISSCGKNLFDGNIQTGWIDSANDFTYKIATSSKSIVCKCKPNTNYVFSVKESYDRSVVGGSSSKIKFGDRLNPITATKKEGKVYFNSDVNSYVAIYFNTVDNIFTDIQLEEGTESTPYEPYQENKCDILLPCQLEKVGDVSDRIVYKEGVWGVEKNIHTEILGVDNSYNNTSSYAESGYRVVNVSNLAYPCVPTKPTLMCNKLNYYYNIPSLTEAITSWSNAQGFVIKLAVNTIGEDSLLAIKEYIVNNNFIVKYPLQTPTFIPLPRNTQIQLNSFFGTTHIYMESGEVEGTIKCKIPKSIGATVQSLNNKTDILSDRIEAIEGLKDSQNMKYETDKGYLVCKETKNGVIDDLKIEGKTLVNLCPKYVKNSDLWVNKTFESDSDGFVTVNANGTWVACPRLKMSSTNIKPNTTYTVILEVKSNTLVSSDNNGLEFSSTSFSEFAFKWNKVIKPKETGTFVHRITSLTNLEGVWELFRTQIYNTCTEGSIVYRWHLLEGDHTQNPPSYFEGLMSVGQDVDEIEVLSSNVNLIDVNKLVLDTSFYEWKDGKILYTRSKTPNGNYDNRPGSSVSDCVVTLSKNTDYTLNVNSDTNVTIQIINAETWETIKHVTSTNVTFNTGNTSKIRFKIHSSTTDFYFLPILSKGTEIKNYVEHQQDKKQILFYNENGELESVTELHEWDSIEKHSDNKWYYHKRSGKVVLNGSESGWNVNTQTDTTMRFEINMVSKNMAGNRNPIICDKFNLLFNYELNCVEEGVFTSINGSTLFLNISKSKLSTQDVQGFKQWLQANNVTVVYQLAQEEVYELAPLHLDSYANETLILCNSGAISPKMEFSITSHINELVKSQGDRISLLEEKMYKALKQVLAGDMYSLAELLYPEDFVEENPENEIMLLPFE